jgi:hypothetical protein
MATLASLVSLGCVDGRTRGPVKAVRIGGSVFSTDQTHLRRYFATLGVAITVGTLSLAGLFLKLQQDLLVPQSTLAGVTPTARNALLKRQEYLAIGTNVLPWFVLVGFIGGAGLSVYGIIGWARRQRILDEREDIGLRKDQVELFQLTDAEKADKLDREAKGAVEVIPATQPARMGKLAEVRSELVMIENQLASKLSELVGDHRVDGPTIISTSNGKQLEVDAIVHLRYTKIVFELKYAAFPQSVSSRIREGLQQLARAAEVVGANGVLIIVVSDDAKPAKIAQWSEQAEEQASDYRARLNVYVARYSTFLSLSPTDLAARVGFDALVKH